MNEEIALKISKLQKEIEELKTENRNYVKNEAHLIEVFCFLSKKIKI